MSLNRKLQRAKKKRLEKDLKQKLNMFDRIPEQCLVCSKSFDKTDKEQVQSWYVVERRKQKSVNLYCPTCWKDGISMVEQVVEEKKAKKIDRLDYFIQKVRREREELEARIRQKRKEQDDE